MLLRAGDTISGSQASATAVIDGNVEQMFYAKALDAKLEKRKTVVKTLGGLAEQNKAAGWKGTGSLTIYYITSIFRKAALKYAKTGVDTYFTITVVNEDMGSTIGKQTITLFNCNIDTTTLAMLDVESDSLQEDLPFTFEGFDILDEFGKPII